MANENAANGRRRERLDFAGFAQEFLRRNPDYRRDHDTLRRAVARGELPDAQEVMARRWGLCFSLHA